MKTQMITITKKFKKNQKQRRGSSHEMEVITFNSNGGRYSPTNKLITAIRKLKHKPS